MTGPSRMLAPGAFAVALGVAAPAGAWVSAYIENVDVAVTIETDGAAVSVVTVRYVIEAGKFREFRIEGVPPEAEFDLAASWVENDKGDRHPIELQDRRRANGVVRFRLADGAHVRRGLAICRLAVRENLFDSERARLADGTLFVDWTPPIFPDGMGRMTVAVTLAGGGADPAFHIEEDLVSILEPRSSGRTLTLSKFRPSQYYAMPVRFSVPDGLIAVKGSSPSAGAAGTPRRAHRSAPPRDAARRDPLVPLVCFAAIGFGLLGARAWGAGRSAVAAGGRRGYLLLRGLGAPLRWPLVAAGTASGAWLFVLDRPLVGLLVHAAAVLLALPDRFRWIERAPVGVGPWRALAAPSPRTWRSIAAAARRRRRSIVDATRPAGFLLCLAALGAAACALWWFVWPDARSLVPVAADALVLLVPPFIAAPERALPPILPAEAGVALGRVRGRLARRLRDRRATVSFLVQDDARGRPADIRIHVHRPDARFARDAEVAVEWRFTAWGWCPSFAILLRVPAGSRLRLGDAPILRRASCHLAGDLGSETWILGAATPGAAAATVVSAMDGVERSLAAARQELREAA